MRVHSPHFRRLSLHLRPPSRAAAALALSLCLALMACAPLNAGGDPPAAPQTSATHLPSFADVVRTVLPAVVNITAVRTNALEEEEGTEGDEGAPDLGQGRQSPFEQFLRRFFGQQGPFETPGQPGAARHLTALGSGFIIDASGFVVTDRHVIANAEKVTVILQDNSRYPAKIVGEDDVSDLALLKIATARPLPFVTWGDSDAAQVGDWILAVGNPFGLGGTVTAGIISARGRDLRAGPSEDFLQIDAPLNRGNSGGPTFNLDGQVIGINTAIYSPSGGSVGIGFAIPSNLARTVIDQLRAHGRVVRGWLGVQIQDMTPAIAQSFGLTKAQGALVVDVTPGGPADKAGLRRGDVILAFNGSEIARTRDLGIATAAAPIGKAATVTVWRGGGTMVLAPVIGERPQTSALQPARPEPAKTTSSMGLTLAPLSDELRRELRLPATAKGTVVMDVAEDSPFAELGVQRGDVIEEVNRHAVATPQAAAAQMAEALSGKSRSVLLLINRQGTKQYVAYSPGTAGESE